MINAYKIVVVKPEGKRPLVRFWLKLEDETKTDLKETGFEDMDWVRLAQYVQWRASHKRLGGIPWLAELLLGSQEELFIMELILFSNFSHSAIRNIGPFWVYYKPSRNESGN